MGKKTLMAVATLLAGVLSTIPAFAGPKIDFGEESWIQLGLLGQFHYSNRNAKDERVDDFYIRRARIILSGQILEGVKVFVETDDANAGKQGVSSEFKVQDAFVDLQIMKSKHWVKGGLILLPFSFENRSSAASLLGIDYNSETIKFVNDFVWRDNGVSFQGSFADRVGYKVGVFDGYDDYGDKNPDADLRFTGRVDVAVLGAVPTGWFYSQDPVNRETYLYVGAGVDHQDKATLLLDNTPRDNKAWVVDFQSGWNLGEMFHLIFNGAWYNWDNSNFNGNTAFAEGGLRYEKIMGTFKYSLVDPDNGSKLNNYTLGLHYNLKGNNIKGGVEYRWGDSSDWLLAGIQFLL